MARIPDSDLERIKREIPIERLVKAAAVELRKHGANLVGRCPFHEDHTPSLVLTTEKNLWHCPGACNTGGSVIDWIIKNRGVSFRHAVELLRTNQPALATPVEKIVRNDTTTKLTPPVSNDADDREILAQVATYCHETLKQSPEAFAVSGNLRPHASGDEKS